MKATTGLAVMAFGILGASCSQERHAPSEAETAGIDSLNARVAQAYRHHDPDAYAALYTDSAVFEWPAFNTVKGRVALSAMAKGNWSSLGDMDLRLTVARRQVTPLHATEFGAFEQSWRDSTGGRTTEYGRYVTLMVPQKDGTWLIDRFFGFEDSTHASSPRRR